MSSPFALVIEDEPDLSRLFATIINSVGFTTERIADGQVAQKRVANLTPDLVILDLHLPHVSGEDILRQIRADKRLSHTKVIVVSADGPMAERVSPDVDFVLIKPISVKQLKDLARRLYYAIE